MCQIILKRLIAKKLKQKHTSTCRKEMKYVEPNSYPIVDIKAFQCISVQCYYILLNFGELCVGVTSMRIQFIKGNPKVKFYRDYKYFNFESFNNVLDGLLKAENNMNYSTSQNIFLQLLNTHAPVKKKVQKFNNNRFMTKQLRNAFM